jgi:mannan endo-1,4-beta-mannosidase
MSPVVRYQITLDVEDGRGGMRSATKDISHSYSDNCIGSSSSSSSSMLPSSSSSKPSSSSSSSKSSYSSSSVSSSSSSSIAQVVKAQCDYQIQSQWGNGFTAVIRMKNMSNQTIKNWNVNWQYADGSRVTNLWNANYSGGNPYSAKNLSWNASIYPGQTVEFGFQGTKPSGSAAIPQVKGDICQ